MARTIRSQIRNKTPRFVATKADRQNAVKFQIKDEARETQEIFNEWNVEGEKFFDPGVYV